MACTDALGLVPSEAAAYASASSGPLVALPVGDLPEGPVLYRVHRRDLDLTPAARALSALLGASRRA